MRSVSNQPGRIMSEAVAKLFSVPGGRVSSNGIHVQYESGSPNIILIRRQALPAALSASLNLGDSVPSLPREAEACIAASACCSYSRSNSLPSLALAIFGVMMLIGGSPSLVSVGGDPKKSCGCQLASGRSRRGRGLLSNPRPLAGSRRRHCSGKRASPRRRPIERLFHEHEVPLCPRYVQENHHVGCTSIRK